MNLLLFGAPGTGKGTQSSFLVSHYNIAHISTGDLFRKALCENTALGLQARSYMDRGDLVPDSIVIALIEEVLVPLSFHIKNLSNDNSKNTDKLTKKVIVSHSKHKILPSEIGKKPRKSSRRNIADIDRSGLKSSDLKTGPSRGKGREVTEKSYLPGIKLHKGFILDGFPRTLAQAESLNSLLDKLELNLDAVLYLSVPEKVLVERIVGRRVAEKSGYVYHIKFKPPGKEGVCDKSGERLVHRNDDKDDVVKQRLKTYREQTAPLIEYYRKKNILFELDGSGAPDEVFSCIKTIIPTFS